MTPLVFLLRIPIGLLVLWIIWKMARPLARLIQQGSTVGIVGGGLVGAILGVLGVFTWTQNAPMERNALTGPGLVIGCLFGFALGATILPKGERKPEPAPADLSDELVDADPRWSEAVDHFDRFKTAKDRASGTSRKSPPPEDG